MPFPATFFETTHSLNAAVLKVLPRLNHHDNVSEPLSWLDAEFHLLERTRVFGYQLQQVLKRCLDLALVLVGIALVSPLLLAAAVAVKVSSPGPILYKSPRVGKNRQIFQMYKFRTMVDGADQLRDQLRKESGQEGKLFKLKNDVRVTPIGQFLRKSSIDELPQLINVLRGEMSLVGPRPFSPDNCEYFEAPYTLRFLATPGMTGPWQVSGRSNASLETAANLDLNYVLGWNLLTDFKILLKTVPAVLQKTGAC